MASEALGEGRPPVSPVTVASASHRKRRSSAKVRELIMAAAGELFAVRGYEATTTRDIALEAGVVEASIFRQFGTKAKLFEAAVVEPYHHFMTEFMSHWTLGLLEPRENEDVVRDFVVNLYEALSANKALVLSYILATRFHSVPVENGDRDTVVARELRKMDDWVRHAAAGLAYHDIDIPVTLRCAFAMVMGMVLHDELLFEQGRDHPGRERLQREMTTFIMRGIAARRADLTS